MVTSCKYCPLFMSYIMQYNQILFWVRINRIPRNLSCRYYGDIIMSTMASQITSVFIVCSTVCSDTEQKHQSSVSLAFMRGIHSWLVNSPQKGPAMWKMFPFDYVIVWWSVASRRALGCLILWETDIPKLINWFCLKKSGDHILIHNFVFSSTFNCVFAFHIHVKIKHKLQKPIDIKINMNNNKCFMTTMVNFRITVAHKRCCIF